jgi:hypothetical protein
VTKRCPMTICFAVLAISTALAQENNSLPAQAKQADNGPSLEVTMQFIQDKLKAKLKSPPQDVVADPAACTLKIVHHTEGQTQSIGYYGGFHYKPTISDEYLSIPFRDVEKIEVMAGQQYQSLMGNEDADSASGFILRLTMTTNTSVTRQTIEHCEKKGDRCLRDGDDKKVESNETVAHAGSWIGWFDDADTPNRIAKAMSHAAELCGGGKAEPF